MSRIYKIYWLLSNRLRISVLFIIGLFIISMILETLSVALILPALNIALENSESLFEKSINNENPLYFIAIIILIVFVVKFFFTAFTNWKLSSLIYKIQAQLSNKFFNYYINQTYSFHLKRNSSQLIKNIITEIEQLTQATIAISALISEILIIFALIILLLVLEPLSAIIAFIIFGIGSIFLYKYTNNYLLKWGKLRQKYLEKRIKFIQQGFGALKDIKILGKEDFFSNQYSSSTNKSALAERNNFFITSLSKPIFEILIIISILTIIYVMVLQGNNFKEIIPTLGVFAAASFRLLPSFNKIIAAVQSFRYHTPVIDNLSSEIINSIDRSLKKSEMYIDFKKNIEILNVSFKYEDSELVALKNINIKIPYGSSVGIVGESGSGKSTLISLILGLIDPNKGEITVDNKNISTNKKSWQRLIGYIPQNIYLIDDTIKNNIALGIPENQIDNEKINKAISNAQIGKFIMSLPEHVNTIVGERGAKLSGGQAQRIGIARALYNDPSLIIFDEATSALDAKTEKDLIECIERLSTKKTIIMISHRLSTLKNCNIVYNMKEGEIIN